MMDIEFTAEEEMLLLKKRKAKFEQSFEKLRFSWRGLIITSLAFCVFGAALFYIDGGNREEAVLGAFAGIIFGVAIYSIILLYLRLISNLIGRSIDTDLLKAGAANLQDNLEDDFVTKLIKINFKYLDRYYEQTQGQANKSFLLSAFASLAGLFIIGIGIYMMYRGDVKPAYVTTAAGVASEFIAAIFFYFYNQTISKMSDYHDKLVVTQNVSIALKIAEDLEGQDKIDTQKMLVERLTEKVNHYLTQIKE